METLVSLNLKERWKMDRYPEWQKETTTQKVLGFLAVVAIFAAVVAFDIFYN